MRPVAQVGPALLGSARETGHILVFGATDFAAAVARIGVFLGHRVTVCDARPVFATARRLPEAQEVVCEWPDADLAGDVQAGAIDSRTVMTVLTHDPKLDVPLLQVALPSPAGYIGAMGSRRTHADRLRRLREAGVDEALLGRLHSPIGLALGARTAEAVRRLRAAGDVDTPDDLAQLSQPSVREGGVPA